jgi:hypothetical protein
MKIHPGGDELFHADRRTDMTKLIVAFQNFANASKNACVLLPSYQWLLYIPPHLMVLQVRVMCFQVYLYIKTHTLHFPSYHIFCQKIIVMTPGVTPIITLAI